MKENRKKYRSTATITTRRKEKFARVISMRQHDLTIVVENVHDPHNVSAVLRTADAVGIETVHLIYSIESAPAIGKKASASARKWIDLFYHRTVDDCYAALRRGGFTILASHLTAQSQSLYEIDLTQPVAFVLGNEHRGVSDEACSKADGVYSIPMIGMIQSLNISVAAAVSMYEALRQRLRAGRIDGAIRSDEEIALQLESWAKK